MKRIITAKNLIKLGFIGYMLFCFGRTWLLLGIERSIDAAAGFMMGLIFMASLFLVLKCVGFLCDDAKDRITERKMKRNGDYFRDGREGRAQ